MSRAQQMCRQTREARRNAEFAVSVQVSALVIIHAGGSWPPLSPLSPRSRTPGTEGPNECVHMPCAARAPEPRPTLFVVAAHVPNQQNCALLRRTVATIHCFHPQDTVLVVDNNSPPGNVEDALHMSPAELALHVIRPAGPSRAQLGAWAAACPQRGCASRH